MNKISMMRLLFLACSAAPFCVLMLSLAPAVSAQENTGTGLVIAVDVGRHTLMVETGSGSKTVRVATTATIRDDHGHALAFGDIRPGDAIAYQVAPDPATRLHVARQFWAIPPER